MLLALAILLVGHIENTLFIGIALCNTAMGIFQEVRAKRTLDRLSILAQTKAHAVRDGKITAIGCEEIVMDDVILLQTGNQVCADAVVLQSQGLEMDEALLTGEPDGIRKEPGDKVMSRQFCRRRQRLCARHRRGRRQLRHSPDQGGKARQKEPLQAHAQPYAHYTRADLYHHPGRHRPVLQPAHNRRRDHSERGARRVGRHAGHDPGRADSADRYHAHGERPEPRPQQRAGAVARQYRDAGAGRRDLP